MQKPLRHATLYSIAIAFFLSLSREIDFSTCETGSLNLMLKDEYTFQIKPGSSPDLIDRRQITQLENERGRNED